MLCVCVGNVMDVVFSVSQPSRHRCLSSQTVAMVHTVVY